MKLKNAALTMAVLLALTACGGDSDDPAPVDNVPTQPGNDQGTDPGTNPGTDPGTNPGTDPGTNPGATPDHTFTGNMIMHGNTVLFNGATYSNQIGYSTFNTTGAYAQEAGGAGSSAPLASFGVRIGQAEMLDQSGNVRVAVEFDNVENGQVFKFLVDKATLSVGPTGAMTLVVPDDANAYVSVTTATGETALVSTADIPATAVTITSAPVDGSDPNSFGLVVNLDAIMDAALAAATAEQRAILETASNANAAGRYTLRMAVTGITLQNSTGTAVTVDAPITVGTQAPVSGAGVSGLLYHNVAYPG